MKTKLLTGLMMAAGLLASGWASAAPFWTGSLADWAASGGGTGVIVDADHDMRFTLYAGTTTVPNTGAVVTLSETQLGGVDYYDVGLAWNNGWSGVGQLVYTMEAIGAGNERINGAAMDTVITGAGTKGLLFLYDTPTTLPSVFLNLNSTDGAHDPLTGYAGFAGRSLLGVVENFQATSTGQFDDAHASFTVTDVPEPGTLPLVALSLLGLARAATRRRG